MSAVMVPDVGVERPTQRPAAPPVLLVDDRPENLVALAAVLEPLGARLVMAGSGEEALAHLLREDFSAILLDVQMPGLDGFETAEAIRRRPRTRHIPILFLTAISTEAQHVFRGYEAGAVDYLLKPYEPAVLRSKVAVFMELYERRRALADEERRFRAAFDDAPTGMAIVGPEEQFARVNRALAALTGRSQAMLLADGARGIAHPQDRARQRREIDAVLAGESDGFDLELRLVDATGSEISVQAVGSPLRGSHELLVHYQDLTARYRAERERNHRLRERIAREEAQRAARRLANIQAITDAALAPLALDELLRELLERIAEILDADAVELVLLGDEDSVKARHERRSGASADVLRDSRLAAQVAGERRALMVGGPGETAMLGVPMLAGQGVLGVLQVCGGERRFGDEDAALLQLAADRAALAVQRARSYEEEHRIADTLQRALLPERLPPVPGLALAARYLPASEGRGEVGGDWYDAVRVDDATVTFILGDVAGRGIEAAALMGQLRSAARTHALAGSPPEQVLGRLSRYLLALDGQRIATVLVATLDIRSGSLVLAAAGHPPPLLLHDGDAELVPCTPQPPLGFDGSIVYAAQAADFVDGARLVIYSDGLVERRGESIDDGFARLRAAALSGPDDAHGLCSHLAATVAPAGRTDDVTLLVVGRVAARERVRRLDIGPDPARLAEVRDALRALLSEADAEPAVVEEIVLACHEACQNAVQHVADAGRVTVDLALRNGAVSVVVRDDGRWRAPLVPEERGRESGGFGLVLMRALMDEVEVVPGEAGTTVELRRRLAG